MAEYDFSQVDVLVIDPQPPCLRIFREALMGMGVRNIATQAEPGEFARQPGASEADLIIIDADGADSASFGLVRTLRNDLSANNPFTCIIVTTWQPTPTLLARFTNSGADDLLLKPVSARQVRERVMGLIEGRRKFVVTADYFGPDRRKAPRPSSTVPMVEVPNTLRLKSTGRWPKQGGHEVIAFNIAKVGELKLMRGSIQATFLIDYALPGLKAEPADKGALDHLGRVPVILEELRRCIPERDREGPVARALRELLAAVTAVREPPAGAALADLTDLLPQRARTLMREANPGREPEALEKEVAEAVTGYRQRLTQLLAARQEGAKVAASGGDNP